MDIRFGINIAVIFAVIIALLILRAGIRSIQVGRAISYFRQRRQKINQGWWYLGVGTTILITAGGVALFTGVIANNYYSRTGSLPSTMVTLASIETVQSITTNTTTVSNPRPDNDTLQETPTQIVIPINDPTQTNTETNTATSTITVTPSYTQTLTKVPTSTPIPTQIPSETHTPTSTKTSPPSSTPTKTKTPTPTRTPLWEKQTIYFSDMSRNTQNSPPGEVGVIRYISTSENPITAILDQYFKGVGTLEKKKGLERVLNGFKGYRKVDFSDGIVHVYLRGECESNGTDYTIAQPIMKNLKQIPEIKYVKIYDQNSNTRDPLDRKDSAPLCLDPSYVPSATPTFTFTHVPTSTASKTKIPSRTPTSTNTPTRIPTRTNTPSQTPSYTPTFTAAPTTTSTATITKTPLWSQLEIYFIDNDRLKQNLDPFEVNVSRTISTSTDPIRFVLNEYFKGPSETEKRQGLGQIVNGFTGFSRINIKNGILHIYFQGSCKSTGTAYNITQPLLLSFKQFSEIRFVKFYDEYGLTRDADGQNNSSPVCLDPSYTPSPTPSITPAKTSSPTITHSPTPTKTPTITLTPSRTPSATGTPTNTFTPSGTPSKTPSATSPASFTPSPTDTQTSTITPRPTRTPTRIPTKTPTSTSSATITFTSTFTDTPSQTPTRTFTPSKTSTSTVTYTPSQTPTHTKTPTATQTPLFIEQTVYFTNNDRLLKGLVPYDEATRRMIPSSSDPIIAVLDEFFKGPSNIEGENGLILHSNGFTGYSKLEISGKFARVYLVGSCESTGLTYSIAQPLTKNIKQFPEIKYVKIYDQYGSTLKPFGPIDSSPICLDPTFKPSPTPTATFTPTNTPTMTASSTATPTYTPSNTPTQTPTNTHTQTVTATFTHTPTPTATETNTNTPTNTATLRPTRTPTNTPSKTPTRTDRPTFTPTNTATQRPTQTPTNTPTKTPTPTDRPTFTPTYTATRQPTQTPTNTSTPTNSPTFTPTYTATQTYTPTSTSTPRPTATLTYTATNTPTNTVTVTFTPAPTATPRPTRTPTFTPTNTSTPSSTPTFTPTRTPTNTPLPTATSVNCDRVSIIEDVTIPNGTIFGPGEAFIKTWRLRNDGVCTWTTEYRVVYSGQDRLNAPYLFSLPKYVHPGQTIDISIWMRAPVEPGIHQSNFKLMNDSGLIFGTGAAKENPFGLEIFVQENILTFDFVKSYCSALWYNATGTLPCPGRDGDPGGFVTRVDNPRYENSTITSSPGLLTVPQNAQNGYILGIFPTYRVQQGDHFESIVTCEDGAADCYVVFQLDYQIDSGEIQTFWAFVEQHEGVSYQADIDLSSLAGQDVNFILSVWAVGSADGDRALWGVPRIVRRYDSSTNKSRQFFPSIIR